MQNSVLTAKATKADFATTENERPTKRAKVVCEAVSNLALPSGAAFLAIFAERDEFKSRTEALMFEN